MTSTATGVGYRSSMDWGWKFHRGDIEMPYPHTGADTCHYTKAGAAPGPQGLKYDDSSWRMVDLPHDFVLEGPLDPNANVAQIDPQSDVADIEIRSHKR